MDISFIVRDRQANDFGAWPSCGPAKAGHYVPDGSGVYCDLFVECPPSEVVNKSRSNAETAEAAEKKCLRISLRALRALRSNVAFFHRLFRWSVTTCQIAAGPSPRALDRSGCPASRQPRAERSAAPITPRSGSVRSRTGDSAAPEMGR